VASHTAVTAQHATLSGTTADTITLSGAVTSVDVLNRAAAGGADMYANISWHGATPTAPVAAADDLQYIPAGGYCTFTYSGGGTDSSVVVQVVGNGNDYSVIGSNPLLGLAT
jgi:hypothetical protein